MQKSSLTPLALKTLQTRRVSGTLQNVGRHARGNSIIFFNLDSRAYAFMHSIRALISSVICGV